MNEELRSAIEREVSGWPGVSKKTDENGPGGVAVTGYRFGGGQIGHVHHYEGGLADFSFPRGVRDDLLRSGKAIPHPAFPNSRTVVSHPLRSAEDLPGAIELFRMNYERAKEIHELRVAPDKAARVLKASEPRDPLRRARTP